MGKLFTAMLSVQRIDQLIRQACQSGLIRLDDALPPASDPVYALLLQDIAGLALRVRHGMSVRRMMYDFADICRVPLEEQLDIYEKAQPTKKKASAKTLHPSRQLEGLHQLAEAAEKQKLPKPPRGNGNDERIDNPNIITYCDSNGELACAEGYIKVYQTIYSASYGANNYKDVFVLHDKGRPSITIQPAQGGKCNVGIGNPFRAVGWFFNYAGQGSKSPLIRCWEIPQRLFIEMLRHCGTEWQVAQANRKQIFVEMCDHKAANQFGLWTHEADGQPNAFGRYFLQHCRNLITYYDPNGEHVPSKRDGECRPIQNLLRHLGIPMEVQDRFHNLSTCLSDADSNLTMNEAAAENDQKFLELIDALEEDSTVDLTRLDASALRSFANLLTYNGMSPQRRNTGVKYTKSGLSIANLRIETDFMLRVYQGRGWHNAVRTVLGLLGDNLNRNDLKIPEDIAATLPGAYAQEKTYAGAINKLKTAVGGATTLDTKIVLIDALNGILRPLCSGSNLKLKAESARNEAFFFPPFAREDLKYQIGASHRSSAVPLRGEVDSLDGYKRPGFVANPLFTQELGTTTKTSNTEFQLFEHSPIIARLRDQEIPVMGGISGTTRDIFRYLGAELRPFDYWQFFSVVAAFMIKHRYHSLIECFIAAQQFYLRGVQQPFIFRDRFDAASLYSHIRLLTGVQFV